MRYRQNITETVQYMISTNQNVKNSVMLLQFVNWIKRNRKKLLSFLIQTDRWMDRKKDRCLDGLTHKCFLSWQCEDIYEVYTSQLQQLSAKKYHQLLYDTIACLYANISHDIVPSARK